MSNNCFDKNKFEERVNELGIAAVNAKGTTEFDCALRKLYVYFRNGYWYYIASVFGYDQNDIDDEKQSKFDAAWIFAFEEVESGVLRYMQIIKNKVERYNPEKSTGSGNPFFAYLYTDFCQGGKNGYNAEKNKEQSGYMTNLLSDNNRRIIKKALKLLDSRELYGKTYDEKIKAVAEKCGIKENKLQDILKDCENQQVIYADKPDENGFPLFDRIPDRSAHKDDSVEKAQNYLARLNSFFASGKSLKETHKEAYPPYLTNRLIKSWVEEVQKNFNQTFEEAVKENWDYLNLDEKRGLYSEKAFPLCIREFMYNWFADDKRRITDAEIAKKIGMSPSQFSKTIDRVEDLIRKNATEVFNIQ